MEWFSMLLIAVGLAMDAFAVSLGIGTGRAARAPRPIFRLSFHMGFFQGFMTFLGWLAGSTISRWVSAIGPWIALALLGFIGTRMIRSGLSCEDENCGPDPSRGSALMVVCVATSIDAMAVGLSFAVLKTPILTPSLVIAVVTLALSLVGLLMGRQLGERFGKRMEVLGGIILNGIGLRIVLAHIF